MYQRRGLDADGDQLWLYLAPSNKWIVSNTKNKDARGSDCVACTAASVADGTLPHEAPAGGWKVVLGVGGQGLVTQPAVTVMATAAAGELGR